MFRGKKALLLAGLLVLSGCSSSVDGGGGAALGQGAASASDAPAAVVTITPASDVKVSPATPITVKASDGKLTEVTVTGSDGRSVAGTTSADGLSWTSTGSLGYGRTYRVMARATGRNGKPVERDSRIGTVAPKPTVNANPAR